MYGWPSRTVTVGTARSAGRTLSCIRSGASARPRGGPRRIEEQAGAGAAHDVGREYIAASMSAAPAPRARARHGDDRKGGFAGAAQRVAARDDVTAALLAPGPVLGHLREGLVDSRRYADLPPGRPIWAMAASSTRSRRPA